jgi:DNA replication protein DnaC
MINDETKRKLRELALDDFVEVLNDQERNDDYYTSLSFSDRLNLVVDDFYNRKNATRSKRLINSAKLRYPAADVTTIYYEGRELDKNQLLELSTCNYFKNNRNIIINGFTGSGKSFVACALGKAACKHLYRTRYFRMPELMEMLNLTGQTGGSISRAVTRLSNYNLLIVDEWLLDIPSETEQKYLLEIFEKRYDLWPTILCTQYKISEWHPRLGSGVFADAIMDRIVHNAVIVSSGKYNMREFLAKDNIC